MRLIRNLCRDDPAALDALDRVTQRPTRGDRKSEDFSVDNVNADSRPAGNSRDAALRRLRRDRPDLHRRVVDRELSCHAAMVEAGFRKRLTALEQVLRLLPKLSVEEEDTLFSRLLARRRRRFTNGALLR
jgi:hypothetical protein